MLTNKKVEKFFTSACAVIHLKIDQWSELKESDNELVHFFHPAKEIKQLYGSFKI